MDDRFKKITERCAKATCGPWSHVSDYGEYVRDRRERNIGLNYRTEDADFIANAREDIPYLLTALAKKEKLLSEAVEGLYYIHCAGQKGCEICRNKYQCGESESHIGECSGFEWRGAK